MPRHRTVPAEALTLARHRIKVLRAKEMSTIIRATVAEKGRQDSQGTS